MKSRLVGFLKQANNRVSDWYQMQIHSVLFSSHLSPSQKSVRLIRAEMKRTQLCLQTESTEKNQNHFIHRRYRDEHNKSTSRKKKIITPNALKNVLYADPTYFDKLKPEPSPIRKSPPDLQLSTMSKCYSKCSTALA